MIFMTRSSSAKRINAALLVIGDEILSGRTQDLNIVTIAQFCTEMGIDLKEVRIVCDDTDVIVEALNAMRPNFTYIFTTGGIGPTHDDITADAIARAFNVDLPVNPDARRMLEEQNPYADMSKERLRMARIPEGASLIKNLVSGAPGFVIENVFVLAGVPKIMQAMLEDVSFLLPGSDKMQSENIYCGVGESKIAGELGKIQELFPDVKIGSYPQMGKAPFFSQLVLRSTDKMRLKEAVALVQKLVDRAHIENNIEIPQEADQE